MVHFIKTNHFKADGRLLKWLDSLSNHGFNCSVYLLSDLNVKNSYYDGVHKITETRLLSRKIFKKRKGYIFKVPEYAIRFTRFIFKSTDRVFIFHDGQQYLNILITVLGNDIFWKKTIVWDLHELPHPIFLRTGITKWLLSYLLNAVDLLIYTNSERRDYILKNYNYEEKNYVVLNNYPSSKFLNSAKAKLPNDLKHWLSLHGLPYVLWMGAASEVRNFGPVLNAFKKNISKVKLVIMGKVEKEFEDEIGELVNGGHVFNKFVSQEEIISYVDNAAFSVVVYNSDSPNNYLCEPNRLYQLLSRKIPVIGGNNPTIERNIKRVAGGIVLNDDGSNADEMLKAFITMLEIKEDVKKGMKNGALVEMTWEHQFKIVQEKLNDLKPHV